MVITWASEAKIMNVAHLIFSTVFGNIEITSLWSKVNTDKPESKVQSPHLSQIRNGSDHVWCSGPMGGPGLESGSEP